MSEGSIRDELEEIKELVQGSKRKKEKRFKIPMGARLRRGHLKRGYVTVEVINENRAIEFMKVPIIDGTIRLDNTFHAVEDMDLFFYKGKPFLHQQRDKINPWNPIQPGKETYGQKYIMARMKSDLIKATGRKIGIGLIVVLGVIAVVIYYFVTGGTFS